MPEETNTPSRKAIQRSSCHNPISCHSERSEESAFFFFNSSPVPTTAADPPLLPASPPPRVAPPPSNRRFLETLSAAAPRWSLRATWSPRTSPRCGCPDRPPRHPPVPAILVSALSSALPVLC